MHEKRAKNRMPDEAWRYELLERNIRRFPRTNLQCVCVASRAANKNFQQTLVLRALGRGRFAENVRIKFLSMSFGFDFY
jgi:hypothetical protein